MKVDGQPFRSIWPAAGGTTVHIIDQTQLPHVFAVRELTTLNDMVSAIKTMQLRGAPLIGAAAAYGMALAIKENSSDSALQQASSLLQGSRPTAVNLRWALQRMLAVLLPLKAGERKAAAWREAAAICDEDVQLNQAIAGFGLKLMRDMLASRPAVRAARFNILTHCNAGWLATVDWGTALGPVYAAHDAGLDVHVWVDETRPRNQGASLTAWELGQHGVPHTVISDNAGGHLMQQGEVDMVLVGADRVTASGDVCNKIGTYLKALAAVDNGIPFYAAVPSPTIDWSISNGLHDIPIEMRSPHEVAYIQGSLADGSIAELGLLPPGSNAANPAFDVTPARLVTGLITERGICAPHQLATLMTRTA